jgi:hypothetical protein
MLQEIVSSFVLHSSGLQRVFAGPGNNFFFPGSGNRKKTDKRSKAMAQWVKGVRELEGTSGEYFNCGNETLNRFVCCKTTTSDNYEILLRNLLDGFLCRDREGTGTARGG